MTPVQKELVYMAELFIMKDQRMTIQLLRFRIKAMQKIQSLEM